MTSAARLEQLLERAAAENSGGTAVVDPERGEIDYATLLDISAGLSSALAAHGLLAGDRVGLLLSKSLASVAALYGCLRTGAAYVPVDVTGPLDRAVFIFRDCGVRAVFIETALVQTFLEGWDGAKNIACESLARLGAYRLEVSLLVFEAGGSASTPPASLAYILYTSGSTGSPKGVMHTHRSALAFVDWCLDEFEPTAADRFSSHAPFHFDLSIFDLYVAAAVGATLVLISESTGKQPQQLAELIETQRISVWYSTPSILRMLVEFGGIASRDCTSLRLALFAGETYPLQQFLQLRACWPRPVFYNLYGPTETNVCTFYRLPADLREGDFEYFPVGLPCSGDRVLIVDAHGSVVEGGGEGELLVSGESVMVGYWNLPDRNREAFMEAQGRQWYRTGDIVRRLPDGNIHYLSRRDRMIKRRGYRVELGEIESALYHFPGLVEAAAVAVNDDKGNVRVRVFVVPQGEPRPGIIALKTFCSKVLPAYMIPDQFVVLDALPKTSTDKIDYQRLKDA